MTHPGIAELWKPVVNVTDLDEGERFWSALSGLAPQGRHGSATADEYSVLRSTEPGEKRWILLQLVPEGEVGGHGGTHLDFRVDDVAVAVRQIQEIGGKVLRPPGLYPDDEAPRLEWAVMEDPFGNDFCVIRWPLP